jgi:hypothetical protein
MLDLLFFPHSGKLLAAGEEILEAASFDNFAVFEDDDFVHGFDGGETVGNDNGGKFADIFLERFLDFFFQLGVQVRSGFVK